MAKYLPVLAVALTLLAGSCGGKATWTDEGQFDEAIADADRVVVRDGGFNYDGDTGRDAVLFQVTDLKEVQQLRENLVFEKQQQLSVCACRGYPGVDWYRGEDRMAITSIQHGRAVRWKGFQGDVRLTEESGAWLVQWLTEHGVDEAKMALK
jgi:hypothetical protein